MGEELVQCPGCGAFWDKKRKQCSECNTNLKKPKENPRYTERKAMRGLDGATAVPIGNVRKNAQPNAHVLSMRAGRG